ncbi:MAG: hypothetical protein QOG30_3213 [Acidimicrobiaceae bacterium]
MRANSGLRTDTARALQTCGVIDFGAAGLGLAYGTVRLVPADPEWSTIARTLSDDIAQAVPALQGVEHVGSTAVPGLLSKPIVDLALGMQPDSDVGDLSDRLATLGWICRGDAGEDGGLVFVMEDAPWHRVAHAHGVVYGGEQWTRYIALRELLRRSPSARRAYEEAKTELAVRFPDDHANYTAGKTPTVAKLLA